MKTEILKPLLAQNGLKGFAALFQRPFAQDQVIALTKMVQNNHMLASEKVSVTFPERNLLSVMFVVLLDMLLSPEWTPTRKSDVQDDKTIRFCIT